MAYKIKMSNLKRFSLLIERYEARMQDASGELNAAIHHKKRRRARRKRQVLKYLSLKALFYSLSAENKILKDEIKLLKEIYEPKPKHIKALKRKKVVVQCKQ